MTEIMCTIKQKKCIVFFGHLLVKVDIRRVRIHRKQALGYNHDGAIRVSLSSFYEYLEHLVLIEMGESFDVFSSCIGSFLQTVVSDGIHDDEIVLADKTLYWAHSCHPTSRVDKHIGVPVLR